MRKKQVCNLNERADDYQKAEDDLLRIALKRSHTERFHVMANLMKMSLMLRQASVKHKSDPSS